MAGALPSSNDLRCRPWVVSQNVDSAGALTTPVETPAARDVALDELKVERVPDSLSDRSTESSRQMTVTWL
jgi:hypothetical protein